jgi:hypothetical protein
MPDPVALMTSQFALSIQPEAQRDRRQTGRLSSEHAFNRRPQITRDEEHEYDPKDQEIAQFVPDRKRASMIRQRRSFAETEEILSVFSELMCEIPPDMILQVFANWNRRLWLCLLKEGNMLSKASTSRGF